MIINSKKYEPFQMTLSGRMCLVTDTTYSLISAKIRQQRV